MTTTRFIHYLQEILTMVDPKDKYSVVLARNALSTTIGLALGSQKADSRTSRLMREAERQFDYLVKHADEYAGQPGDFAGNEQKRRRLEMVLSPYC